MSVSKEKKVVSSSNKKESATKNQKSETESKSKSKSKSKTKAEKDGSEEKVSGWGFSKEDEIKYRKEYQDSLKNLNHSENVDIGEIEESSLWVDVYSPKTLKNYIDDNHNIDLALKWLNNFRNRVKKTPPILLLTGKPGIGKTTLAHLLFKELNYEYKEFNASEARSGKEIKEYLEPFNQGNIVEFFEGCEEVKKGLIMDEVDGIDSRSTINDGLSVFLSLTEVTIPDRFKYPIICIANDSTCAKIEKIRRYSFELEMKPPTKNALIKFMERIAKGENIEIEKQVFKDIVETTDPDYRQVANKLYYLATLIKPSNIVNLSENNKNKSRNSKNEKKVITIDDFNEIKNLTRGDKKLELNEIIEKIFDEETSVKETLRLYETDINIITMSFYSNFTENITKLNVSNKDKISTLASISNYLVDGEIYSDYYWHHKNADISCFQGINQIVIPKYLLNQLSYKTKTINKGKKKVEWDFSGKRIFYLNPHIMDRYWKFAISLQIYSHSHLAYCVELIWNLIKSKKMNEQEKTYKKILIRLFEGGIEAKDFENIFKGFTLGQNEIKENEEIYKDLKIVIKKYFTDYQTNCLKEFQVNLESIPGQLDQFLLL
jgi:DNA polymerase III delta prime subunit